MRKLNNVLFTAALSVACMVCNATEKADYRVIPLPQEINFTQSEPFTLSKKTIIVYPKQNALLKRNAEFLAEYIQKSTSYKLATEPAGKKAYTKAIVLSLDKTITSQEGYTLNVTSENITN
uniref:CAZy families CBM32/GH20 protein n=1 Tax=uncultured Capnocytophaga sp. TaxID=159273 RepID=A0A060C3M2_9FLAO|nr:CAZy families CBM32/GH20 protein [uncultured Capnocytophaga sp.]